VEVVDIWEKPRMAEGMWTGHGVFRLATTLAILVTDDVIKAILSYNSTNLVVTES
jgi:hypothetical protein